MKTKMLLLAFAICGMMAPVALAQSCGCDAGAACANDCCGDGCCDNDCGSGKVCKLVCTTKKVKTICYGCKCEDFCVPGRSERGCTHCESVGDCGCDTDCCGHAPSCCIKWTEWIPGCATMRTRKKLVKYEAVKEVPSYKWEVVDACGCNQDNCCVKAAPAGAKLGDTYELTDAERKQYKEYLGDKPIQTASFEGTSPAKSGVASKKALLKWPLSR